MATRTERAGVARAMNLTPTTVSSLLSERWFGWPDCQAILPDPDADALRRWVRNADPYDREQVLRSLIEMASTQGADDDDAAKVAAWLLLGPACVLAWKYRFVENIDHHVAATLWLAIKSNRAWSTREMWRQIPSHIRRQLFAEVSTLRDTLAISPQDQRELYEAHLVAEVEPRAASEEALMTLLEWGVERGVITSEDQLLLLDVVAASGSVLPDNRSASLLGDRVSDAVGLSHGVSGRTIRRRVASSLTRLSQSQLDQRRSA